MPVERYYLFSSFPYLLRKKHEYSPCFLKYNVISRQHCHLLMFLWSLKFEKTVIYVFFKYFSIVCFVNSFCIDFMRQSEKWDMMKPNECTVSLQNCKSVLKLRTLEQSVNDAFIKNRLLSSASKTLFPQSYQIFEFQKLLLSFNFFLLNFIKI